MPIPANMATKELDGDSSLRDASLQSTERGVATMLSLIATGTFSLCFASFSSKADSSPPCCKLRKLVTRGVCGAAALSRRLLHGVGRFRKRFVVDVSCWADSNFCRLRSRVCNGGVRARVTALHVRLLCSDDWRLLAAVPECKSTLLPPETLVRDRATARPASATPD